MSVTALQALRYIGTPPLDLGARTETGKIIFMPYQDSAERRRAVVSVHCCIDMRSIIKAASWNVITWSCLSRVASHQPRRRRRGFACQLSYYSGFHLELTCTHIHANFSVIFKSFIFLAYSVWQLLLVYQCCRTQWNSDDYPWTLSCSLLSLSLMNGDTDYLNVIIWFVILIHPCIFNLVDDFITWRCSSEYRMFAI